MNMNPKVTDITREQMLDLLADVMLTHIPERSTYPFMEWAANLRAASAVLSIDGAVGVYVRFPEPDQVYIPTTGHGYELGWIRSHPEKNQMAVHWDHLANIETGEEDPATHPVGVYFGKPFTDQEIRDAFARRMSRLDSGQKEIPVEWVQRVYGRPPPAEVLEHPTARDVAMYSDWFWGPAYRILSTTDCGHGCNLTDSCSVCPSYEFNDAGELVEMD